MTRHRAAATLVEVLVAIFVMGVGLICLLSLFPLGAMLMAQSIKDNRSGHAGNNADAVAWALRIDRHTDVFPKFGGDGQAAPALDGFSYPVYLDPYGVRAGAGTRIAGANPGIPRTNLTAFDSTNDPTQSKLHEACAVLDDMPFLETGLARTPIRREYRYSWAWLLQRARWSPLASSTENVPISVHVVVYHNRPAAGTGETAYSGAFTAGSRTATLTWTAGQPAPAINNGGWILDGTMSPMRGYFYRVVSTRLTGATSMELELQDDAKATSNPATAIVMEGVVEVFQKSPR